MALQGRRSPKGGLKLEERSLFRVAGDDVVRLAGVKPASKYMHESSLHRQEHWTTPDLRGLGLVQRALEADAALQSKKYGASGPGLGSARFHVDLPRSPQNTKFSQGGKLSLPSTPSSAGSSQDQEAREELAALSQAHAGAFRFNKQTLQQMFRKIDRDGSGEISQRELIVALRNNPEIMEVFCRAQCRGDAGIHAEGSSSYQFRREEIYRIKDIMREVDTDGSGTMEWDEFVDFFRRAGLLLEYSTNEDLNRTSLCMELETQRLPAVEEGE